MGNSIQKQVIRLLQPSAQLINAPFKNERHNQDEGPMPLLQLTLIADRWQREQKRLALLHDL